jgi:regulatory protein
MKAQKAPKLKGSRAEAKTYALKLLSYRSRSRNELFERLRRKGFGSSQINEAIGNLEDAGLINDEDLAPELLRYSVEYKSFGKKGIRTFLSKRGIGRDLIDEVLSNHTPEMEEETAVGFVKKKLRNLKNYPEDIIRQKLRGMLQRRGFSGEVIKRVVNSMEL